VTRGAPPARAAPVSARKTCVLRLRVCYATTMSDRFGKLAERQMQKALAEKKLSGLEGEGRPLPDRPEAALVDAGEAVGYRIMHEHGALPEEIELRKAVEVAKADYAKAETPEEKRAAMARIAELQMKVAIAAEARKRFMG
jgi:Domain of unknown function (DUF1992).